MENQVTLGDSFQKVNILIHRTADEVLVLAKLALHSGWPCII